ncbi:HAD-IA family hydrolase [Chitinilyticum litopenaei]|uniref:HAD-IA family hydrolase n=1 Tax=Chitinilyticum litopenaei TaxID=1121276 RepID=UPI0004063B3E|nr:HAD-IA family hydrolase [Chitinilyticum litopenaei]
MSSLTAPAFLFDMDGTLLDSTANIELIWGAWCARHGIPLAQVLAICHGVPSSATIAQVAPHLDLEAESAWLDELEVANCEGVVAIAGAAELLASLPPERWALVTSATRPVLEKRLRHCGLPLPAHIVSVEDVQRGKPDPEPYLRAAALLGVDPAACLVFEDAPAGLQSAAGAGARLVQIGGAAPLHPAVLLRLPDWRDVRVSQGAEGLTLVVTGAEA